MKIVLEQKLETCESDAAGQDCVASFDKVREHRNVPGGIDPDFRVELISFQRMNDHTVIPALMGKVVRITIETLDELPTGTVWTPPEA